MAVEVEEREAGVAVTTIVGLLAGVIGLLFGLFRFKTVSATDTNTTDNNGLINGIYYPHSGGLTTVVDGFLYDYNGFDFCLTAGLIAPVLASTINNERKRKHNKSVSNTPYPAPRRTPTKEKEVKYDYCDLICNIIAELTAPGSAIAAVTNNNKMELGTEVPISIDNCFERGKRGREYNKGVSRTPRAISNPTSRPAPAKEREVEYCDLICNLLIAGLTAPTVTVEIEFDNNIIRGGFKFGAGVPITTTEVYPLNMDTHIN